MLFDVIVRLLAAIGLTLITNAKGITTTSVVVSFAFFYLWKLVFCSKINIYIFV